MEQENGKFNDECPSGDICPESAFWICSRHSSIKIYVNKGDRFPRCHQGAGHPTTWLYAGNK